MPSFTLTLERRHDLAERTMAFHFRKPERLSFVAGQALDLTLVTPPETDAEGNIRTFTIASAPQDDEVVVATRLRDTAFKRVLASLPIGATVEAEGPEGAFTLHDDADRPAVFLTGGIGITPFRSMVRDAKARRLAHPLWLFYSNRRPEDAAYLDELQALADAMPSLHFVPTMTEMAKSHRGWTGEVGVIDLAMINRRGALLGPRYYLAGPPAMVTAMRTMLTAAHVPDTDIQFEEFSGY